MLRKVVDLMIAKFSTRKEGGNHATEVVLRAAFLPADAAVLMVECLGVRALVLKKLFDVEVKVARPARRAVSHKGKLTLRA